MISSLLSAKLFPLTLRYRNFSFPISQALTALFPSLPVIFASQWSAYRKEIVATDQQQAVPGGKTKQHSKGQSRLSSKRGPSEVRKIKGAFASSRSARDEGVCLGCAGEWWSHSWLLWFAWHTVREARDSRKETPRSLTWPLLLCFPCFRSWGLLRCISQHR